MGLAYIPKDMVEKEIQQGELVQVLEEFSIQFSGYHLYYPHRRQQSSALKLVIESLRV
ncbi:lysR substrate binding domain protein [Acinetobacter baumannii 4749]|nr:lysR substrate binding domain protein [Acinetobacter baumannii 4749]